MGTLSQLPDATPAAIAFRFHEAVNPGRRTMGEGGGFVLTVIAKNCKAGSA